jgi:hypothetical protein
MSVFRRIYVECPSTRSEHLMCLAIIDFNLSFSPTLDSPPARFACSGQSPALATDWLAMSKGRASRGPRRMAAQAGIVPSPAWRGDISHQCSHFFGKLRPELVERASLRRRSGFRNCDQPRRTTARTKTRRAPGDHRSLANTFTGVAHRVSGGDAGSHEATLTETAPLRPSRYQSLSISP